MAEPTLDEIRAEVEEAKQLCERLLGANLPNDLSHAIDQRWDFAFDLTGAGAADALYPDEEQREDKKRVVPIRWVFLTIEGLEEGLIDALVKKDSIPARIVGVPKALVATGKIGFNVWLWSVTLGKFGVDAWPLIKAVLTDLLLTFRLTALVQFFNSTLKLREKWEKEMVKKVLPQRTGQRYRRRKRAR